MSQKQRRVTSLNIQSAISAPQLRTILERKDERFAKMIKRAKDLKVEYAGDGDHIIMLDNVIEDIESTWFNFLLTIKSAISAPELRIILDRKSNRYSQMIKRAKELKLDYVKDSEHIRLLNKLIKDIEKERESSKPHRTTPKTRKVINLPDVSTLKVTHINFKSTNLIESAMVELIRHTRVEFNNNIRLMAKAIGISERGLRYRLDSLHVEEK